MDLVFWMCGVNIEVNFIGFFKFGFRVEVFCVCLNNGWFIDVFIDGGFMGRGCVFLVLYVYCSV